MKTVTILYCFLALLLSLSVAFFQYYYKEKQQTKISMLLFFLKSTSLFLLILLVINPIIKKTEIQNRKPVLALLVDDSKSITFFKEENNIQNFLQEIKRDKSIQEKFDLQEFTFGSELNPLDSLSFTDNETNISEAIVAINELYHNKIAPIILLTDGNQTVGNDYEFITSQQVIYPIVFGDTTAYKDIKISQLNVNTYSYIENKFPVEVLLNYEGEGRVTSQFSITKNGKTVFTKRLQFSPTNNSKTITTNLTSSKEGLQYYAASISEVKGEKNIKNNTKNFSVEVINEQTKVLILTSVMHPDIGALKKAIETNKQRSVSVYLVDDFKHKINDFQLVILYQPNNSFKIFLDDINRNNINYFLISGVNTAWDFINKQQLGIIKKTLNQTENYTPAFNTSFLTFLQKDIGFNQFPPLKDKFGEVLLSKEFQTVLFQNINGLETQQPLLALFENNNQKSGVLFGEGFWKWRAASFLNSNSFQDFDGFIGNLIEYLASNKKRSRLAVKAARLYPANSIINISAFYTDKNYKFDSRASLEIHITNTKTKKVTKIPFSLMNNSYQSEIENLSAGEYQYKISVIGQNIHKSGKFKINEYQIEELFTNANFKKLLKLTEKTGVKIYFKNEITSLKNALIENKAFYTSQKSIVKEQYLIDWKLILFTIVGLQTIEWFVRKYYGKI